MLFFLRLVRLVFGLIAKVVLFPFKLVLRLVRGGQGSDVSVDGDELLDVGPAQAATHISRFRKGLLVLGAFQLVVVLFAAMDLASQVPASAQSTLMGGVAVIAAIAVLTLLLGYALASWPTGAWYGAMGLVGIQFLGSLFTLPGGVLGLAIFGLLGYWGYTGRPALGAVYGSGDAEPRDDATATSGELTDPTADASTAAAAEPAEPDPTAATDDEPAASAAEPAAAGAAEGQPSTADGEPVAESTTTAASADTTGGEREDTTVSSAQSGADEAGTTVDDTATATSDTEAADETAQTDTASEESQPAGGGDGDPVAPYAEDLTAADAATRATAVRDLADAVSGQVPAQAVVDALTERLDDDDPSVRAAACEELGRLGVSDARPQLEDRRIDPDPEVSRAASRALRNID